MEKILFGFFFILTTVAGLFSAWDLLAYIPEHREVPATVQSLYCTIAFVKTEEGITRNVMLQEIKRDTVPFIKEGDKLLLELNEKNDIIGIHPPHRHSLIADHIEALLNRIEGSNRSQG